MDLLQKIAEQRIREAIERGEFDDLAHQGKPVTLEDLSGLPETLRMGYSILKNAGVLPEEMQLRKEMTSLQKLLDSCADQNEQAALRNTMNEKMLRYNMLMERRKRIVPATYQGKILKKLGR